MNHIFFKKLWQVTSSLFSRNSLTDLRATLHAASLGYPYIPVEIQGKAWSLKYMIVWFVIVSLWFCIWQTEYRLGSVTETHNGFEPGLLHLVETVGVGWPQCVGVFSLGAHCGYYVWNETSEPWPPLASLTLCRQPVSSADHRLSVSAAPVVPVLLPEMRASCSVDGAVNWSENGSLNFYSNKICHLRHRPARNCWQRWQWHQSPDE